MERIKEQLRGYSWKFKVGDIVRLNSESVYGETYCVLARALGEEISGGFGECYSVRRRDGVAVDFYAQELVEAKQEGK